MFNIFKDVDKIMLAKLVMLHIIVIVISNALVSIPVEIMGVKLTWAAFVYPLVILATDLTVRLIGKGIARATIAVAYPLAIIGSILVVLAEGAPASVALRIGFGSATAYLIGCLLDVYVFQYVREKFTQLWWAAPALSMVFANFIDSYVFFSIAFSGSADEYMSAHWPEIALSQSILKIVVGFIVFLPAYGFLLNFLKKRLGNTDQG
jgi:uncharacterized integral membrane protein (TIGR00697 family)